MGRHPKEYQAFRDLTDWLLAVPRATIQERLARHQEQAAKNPRKRGPKPKITPPSASRDSGEHD